MATQKSTKKSKFTGYKIKDVNGEDITHLRGTGSVKIDKRSKVYRDSLKKLPKMGSGNVFTKKQQEYVPVALKKLQENIEKYAEPAKLSQQGYEQSTGNIDWGGEKNQKNLHTVVSNLTTITDQLFQNVERLELKVDNIAGTDPTNMKKCDEVKKQDIIPAIIDQLVSKANKLVELNNYLKEQVTKLETIVG